MGSVDAGVPRDGAVLLLRASCRNGQYLSQMTGQWVALAGPVPVECVRLVYFPKGGM